MGAAEAATSAPPTATDRVYEAIYAAILEHRAVPGMRLREEELAAAYKRWEELERS